MLLLVESNANVLPTKCRRSSKVTQKRIIKDAVDWTAMSWELLEDLRRQEIQFSAKSGTEDECNYIDFYW